MLGILTEVVTPPPLCTGEPGAHSAYNVTVVDVNVYPGTYAVLTPVAEAFHPKNVYPTRVSVPCPAMVTFTFSG